VLWTSLSADQISLLSNSILLGHFVCLQFPDIVQPVLSSIENIARQCESTLAELCDSTNDNQDLFKTLEVDIVFA
jgi:hypothetical protein